MSLAWLLRAALVSRGIDFFRRALRCVLVLASLGRGVRCRFLWVMRNVLRISPSLPPPLCPLTLSAWRIRPPWYSTWRVVLTRPRAGAKRSASRAALLATWLWSDLLPLLYTFACAHVDRFLTAMAHTMSQRTALSNIRAQCVWGVVLQVYSSSNWGSQIGEHACVAGSLPCARAVLRPVPAWLWLCLCDRCARRTTRRFGPAASCVSCR